MSDSVIEREDIRARLSGKSSSDGTRWGSVNGHRSMTAAHSSSRHLCRCGCRKRATHVGLGDGLALTDGCELSIRRWVRDGYPARATSRQQDET